MSTIITDPNLKKYVFAVYILQALFFAFWVPPVIGIVINYIKDEDVKGSWLESHFKWQKNTFWYGLLWIVVGSLTLLIWIGHIVLSAVLVWFIYRIAKGWIYLVDGKELYR